MPTHFTPANCVTVQEAAVRIGCSRQYLYNRMGRGAMESVKLGGKVFIPVEEVEALKPRRRGKPCRQMEVTQ